MGEHERILVKLGEVLAQIARPYRVDEMIPVHVQSNLWQLGVPCDELTPREELIAELWARKRTLQTAVLPQWGGPGATPPNAA